MKAWQLRITLGRASLYLSHGESCTHVGMYVRIPSDHSEQPPLSSETSLAFVQRGLDPPLHTSYSRKRNGCSSKRTNVGSYCAPAQEAALGTFRCPVDKLRYADMVRHRCGGGATVNESPQLLLRVGKTKPYVAAKGLVV